MNVGLPLADIAQLGERQTEDLKVAGSIPAVGIPILFCIFFLFPHPPSHHPVTAVKSLPALPPAPLSPAANLPTFVNRPQAIPGTVLIKFFFKKKKGVQKARSCRDLNPDRRIQSP